MNIYIYTNMNIYTYILYGCLFVFYRTEEGTLGMEALAALPWAYLVVLRKVIVSSFTYDLHDITTQIMNVKHSEYEGTANRQQHALGNINNWHVLSYYLCEMLSISDFRYMTTERALHHC